MPATKKPFPAAFQRSSNLRRRLSDPAERQRHIWAVAARFANADLAVDEKAFEDLLDVLDYLLSQDQYNHFKYRAAGKIYPFDDSPKFKVEARRYQKLLRNTLLWICKPVSHANLRIDALRFLQHSTLEPKRIDLDDENDAIKLELEQDKDFEDSGRCPDRYFFLEDVRYASVLAPLCMFLFSEIENPPERLPIGLCRRPGCDRFFVPQRGKRKQYCSNTCRAIDHKKDKTKDELADYAFIHRLEKIEATGSLRNKLNRAAVKDRLVGIADRWSWAPEKIKQLRARMKGRD
jgi:hypothetical protein